MKIDAHKFITEIANPLLNDLIGKDSNYGRVWREGVEITKTGLSSPIGIEIDNFRERILNGYKTLEKSDIEKEVQNLSIDLINAVKFDDHTKRIVTTAISEMCQKISNAENKREWNLTINCNEKCAVRIESMDNFIENRKVDKNVPLTIIVLPRLYFIKAEKKSFFSRKKNFWTQIALMSNREINISF